MKTLTTRLTDPELIQFRPEDSSDRLKILSLSSASTDFLIIDLGNSVAWDVAHELTARGGTSGWVVSKKPSQVLRSGRLKSLKCVQDLHDLPEEANRVAQAYVFTPHPFCSVNDVSFRKSVTNLRSLSLQRCCFVTGCSQHFGDDAAVKLEEFIFNEFSNSDTKVSIVRIGFALSPHSPATLFARRFAWARPLLSAISSSTFVRLDELSDALQSQGNRAVSTLLGEHKSWKSVFQQLAPPTTAQRILFAAATALKFVGVGFLLRMVLLFLCWISHKRKVYDFQQITPQSETELLALCQQHNFRHITVCGYNNGVTHFGWQYPGKTVVPTSQAGQLIEVDDDHVLVDAGVTLKQCMKVLGAHGKQFYVTPNYSYIGMGTVFFVPVHGSGSDVSTLGDTVQWVRLFDPATGLFHETTRGETLFTNTMYNRNSGLVLMQMILSVKDSTNYFVQKSEVSDSNSTDVWTVFQDTDASNIEIRKNKASSNTIQISKYYTTDDATQNRLSAPRDGIGRLWDRLEENRLTALLFHFLVRTFAYHVELFLREDEFDVFWKHHRTLPVSKIQLRFVKHDGLPHSPFGEADCISADLFMSRRRAAEFQNFVREKLPNVRLNPGKQSM